MRLSLFPPPNFPRRLAPAPFLDTPSRFSFPDFFTVPGLRITTTSLTPRRQPSRDVDPRFPTVPPHTPCRTAL